MRVLIVGAGCVGSVLARFLEAVKSNEVTYYVRAGRRAQLPRIKLLDGRSGELHVRERPTLIEPDQRPPAVDTVILAVRGDQLDEAMLVIPRLPPTTRICTVSSGHDDLKRLRERFPDRAVVQLQPMFFAFPDGDAIRWWNPPLARTLVSWENDDAARAFADELVHDLVAGGLPTRAVRTIEKTRQALLAAFTPVLAGWELAGWDAAELARNPELRKLLANAIQEALRGLPTSARLFGFVPRFLYQTAMRAAPLLPSDTKEMWRVHGPKIASQTRQEIDALVTQSAGHADGLRELRRRLS
jgi:ketopantoate reductase